MREIRFLPFGVPGSNHEWDMLFKSAYIEARGLTLALSEVEPSPYVKIVAGDCDRAVGWLLRKIWTGDVRHFGADALRAQYEEMISKRVKAKFLGVPKEFVAKL